MTEEGPAPAHPAHSIQIYPRRQDVTDRQWTRSEGSVPLPAVNDRIQRAFGLRVRQLRERRGLTQEKLADLSGLHRTYIWGIEQGRRNPSLTIVVRIAEALGV